MTWIELPGDEETPALARLTKPWREEGLPSVIAAMKHNPGALGHVNRMNNAVTFGGSLLGRREEELIATTVSAYNECFY